MEKAWIFETPKEISLKIAAKEKRLRKQKGITQSDLSQMTGIPLSTIRYFEQKGEMSFVSILKIAMALDCVDEFRNLFEDIGFSTIEEVIRHTEASK